MQGGDPIILPPRRGPGPGGLRPQKRYSVRSVLKGACIVLIVVAVCIKVGQFGARWWHARHPPFPYVQLKEAVFIKDINWLDDNTLIFAGGTDYYEGTEQEPYFSRLYKYEVATGEVTFIRKIGSPARTCVTDSEVVYQPMETGIPAGESTHEYRWRDDLTDRTLSRLAFPRNSLEHEWNHFTCRMEKLPPRARMYQYWALLRAGDGLIDVQGEETDIPPIRLLSPDGEALVDIPPRAGGVRKPQYVPHRGAYFWHSFADGRYIKRWKESNCVDGWWVDAAARSVEQQCIPYPGLQSMVPLTIAPLARGWLIAGGGFGGLAYPDTALVTFTPYTGAGDVEAIKTLVLFRAQVNAQPAISPDGCNAAVPMTIREQPLETVLRVIDFCPKRRGG